ncbi:MAG TPA: zinc metallopeptidase, partial [Bacteroidales bacterium]
HSYAWLTMRSKLVPLQNVSAQVINAVFIIMFIGSFFVHGLFPLALPIIIFCYFIFTVFAFITLPVEMDASRRALVWLSSTNITNDYMHSKAEDALKWAARTYLVAALSSLSMLIYYVMVYLSNRD